MDSIMFEKIYDEAEKKRRKVMVEKATQYAVGGDRLYNFKRASEIERNTPAQALWGKATKHLISIIDMVEGNSPATQEAIDEKIGDMQNYLDLLRAIFIEQLAVAAEIKEITDAINIVSLEAGRVNASAAGRQLRKITKNLKAERKAKKCTGSKLRRK